MQPLNKVDLSTEGRKFLSDPKVKKALSKIAASVGATAEEYLLRFEKILESDPQKILSIFEH